MYKVPRIAVDFIAYEYKTITLQRNMESLWMDSYKHFGWELEKSEPAIVKHVWGPIRLLVAPLAIFPGPPFRKMVSDHTSGARVELTFKRNRSIPRKAELNHLQSQFESHAWEISNLEASRSVDAMAAACIFGLAGTIFIAFSVFSYLVNMLIFSILTAVPGFIAWILSYLIYQVIKDDKAKKVAPLIEQQYDSIYNICIRANELFLDERAN